MNFVAIVFICYRVGEKFISFFLDFSWWQLWIKCELSTLEIEVDTWKVEMGTKSIQECNLIEKFNFGKNYSLR